MRDHLSIGSSPAAESCVQLGSENYHALARAECRAFIAQLRREFGIEPAGARLGIKSNAHDFGDYLEVVCHFDDSDEEAIDYAYRCESSSEVWDDLARAELGELGLVH